METKLRLIKIWWKFVLLSTQDQFLTGWAAILFIIGKVVRFCFFFIFLFVVLSATQNLAGYNREQVIFFFLVFNLIDIIVQCFFRGVYHFRYNVVKGEYDFDLGKPWPAWFRPIFGYTDPLDFITLIPLWSYFIWFVFSRHLFTGVGDLVLFFLLLGNSIILGFSFHLLACSICLLTTEIDHLIWVYRDLTSMAKFPTDIYQKFIQFFLTFTIPVVILFTVPAKALLGLISWPWVILAFAISGLSWWGSMKFWRHALRRYSSASS
jgi:ABC-2 type transport system permease protein